jgi:hypothetical protein
LNDEELPFSVVKLSSHLTSFIDVTAAFKSAMLNNSVDTSIDTSLDVSFDLDAAELSEDDKTAV